jgi:N-carbamoylputrescine amidase
MRTTVCELPDSPEELDAAWADLCRHTAAHRSELLLLPECAFVEPFWESECFDANRWLEVVASSEAWLDRFPELNVAYVVGARPVAVDGNRYNEGFVWSRQSGYRALRRKYFLPCETRGWEAHWFARGDNSFPSFDVGGLTFGLNICTELWALETYGAYASTGIHAILSPRATEGATIRKWLSIGTTAAIRSGAYSLSSNRVHANGAYGGAGWIISPDGELLALTCAQNPFSTLPVDFIAAKNARRTYPRYIFDGGRSAKNDETSVFLPLVATVPMRA